MDLVQGPVRVTVPATSANLGPGYDTLGLALDLHDVVTAEVAGKLTITVDGADQVPLDERHLVYRSMVAAFEQMGIPVPGIRLHCRNLIPHGRGLGSSSAAIVAGVFAARALVADGEQRLPVDALFDLAARIEGHPDNVAPAVYGGLTISYAESGAFHTVRLDVDQRIETVIAIPGSPVSTELARGLLPAQVSHADAAANSGRAALLVAALTGDVELLLPATEDRLHQRYRAPAMEQSYTLVEALRAEGIPAIISGAGPTVLAFAVRGHGTSSVAAAVDRLAPGDWRRLTLAVSPHGAVVEA
ncbi:MAG: homoserine kinase [Nocardioidaceae bacterium]